MTGQNFTYKRGASKIRAKVRRVKCWRPKPQEVGMRNYMQPVLKWPEV